MKQFLKYIVPYVILIVICIPALLPFIHTGFIATDDGSWLIIRLSAFYDSFRDGQFPVRFVERINFGYGYPVSNFLYPGYLYIGSVIHFVGFGFIESVKILFGLSIVFSAFFSYIWFRRLFGKIDSLVGSFVYLYTPYHLFDMYKRGSLGEALSISVLPLAFYGIEKASTILIALSVFSILLFHNTLAVLFIPLIPLYAFMRKSFLRSLPGIILGGLMSSFFTIPAIFELRYTKFLETSISNPFEYFADIQLIGIGSLIIFVGLLFLLFTIYKKELNRVPYSGFVILMSIIFILTLFFSSSFSKFIWENINSSWIQFPYRLLSLVIIASAFFAAYISYILFNRIKIIVGIVIVFITIISAYSYFTAISYTDHPEEFYTTNEATTTIHDEYMPKWVERNPTSRYTNKIEVISGSVAVSNISEKSNLIEFQTVVAEPSVIRVNTIYYPGWKVFVEGEKREINYENERGVIEFELEQYDDRVYISFQEDFVRIIADMISIIAVIILIYYISRPLLKF